MRSAVALAAVTTAVTVCAVGVAVAAGTAESATATRGSATLSAPTAYAAGAAPGGVAVGDLNGDGVNDFAVTNGDADTVSVFLGRAGGGFAAQAVYATTANPASVAFGDITGDGVPDLVVAESDTDAGTGEVSVFPGRGDGTFGGRTDTAVGPTPSEVVLADLNHDGRLDAVAVGRGGSAYGAAGVYVMLNTGAALGASTTLTAGSSPVSVAVADLNGDGIPDLVAADNGDNTLSLFFGNGDGTFGAPAPVTTGAAPTWVATGDLNGDGRADIVVANGTGDTFSPFLQDSDGSFTQEPTVAAGNLPRAITVTDLDGDGHADLVAVNNDSNVVVAMGRGDGTFGKPATFATGGTPLGVAVGDLDGNGTDDVLTSSFGTNAADVLTQSVAPAGSAPVGPVGASVRPGASAANTATARPATTPGSARAVATARASATVVPSAQVTAGAVPTAAGTPGGTPTSAGSAAAGSAHPASARPSGRARVTASPGLPALLAVPGPSSGVTGAAVSRRPSTLVADHRAGRRAAVHGPAAAAYSDSIPSPTQTTAKQVGQDTLLALLLLALLELPVTLVNQTSKHNYAVITGGFKGFGDRLRLPAIADRVTSLPLPVAFAAYSVVAAILYGFIEPSFGFDTSSVALVLGLALAFLAFTATKGAASALFYRRIGHSPFPKVFPGFLLLAVLCVIVSRLLGLEPGLVFGALISIGTLTEVENRDEGRAAALSSVLVAVVAAVAWLTRGSIVSALGHEGGFAPSLVSVALTTLVVVGVQELAIGLLPLTFLEGEKVFRWSKPCWAGLSLVGVFGFVHILLRPRPGEAAYAGRVPTLVILLASYLVVALAYWGFFRHRVRAQAAEPTEPTAPAVSEEPEPVAELATQ